MDPRVVRLVSHGTPDPQPGGDMNEILPGLYLGSWGAAYDVPELERAGVTHILTAMNTDRFPMPEVYLLPLAPHRR